MPVPLSQTNPIALKDLFSYLRKSQVIRIAEKTPKILYTNLNHIPGNIGATGARAKRRTSKRLQKKIHRRITKTLDLLVALRSDFKFADL
jgi:hypothetical protein